MAAQDYASACPKLLRSHTLDPAGGAILFAAKCNELGGRLATAWLQYTEASVIARRDGRTDRLQVAEQQIAYLVPKLAHLTLRVAPTNRKLPGFVLRGNGVVLGPDIWDHRFPVDKGNFAIQADAPGRRQFTRTLTVTDDGIELSFPVPELEEAPAEGGLAMPQIAMPVFPSTPTPQDDDSLPPGKVAALVVGGAGAVAAGLGVGLGFLAKGNFARAAETCPDGVCRGDPALAQENIQQAARARSLGDVATGVGIGGLALLGAGFVFWLATPNGTKVGLAPSFGGLTLTAKLP